VRFYKGGREINHTNPLHILIMRKIETLMNEAINKCIDWKNNNTEVIYSPERDASYVYLHGNHIATIGDTWLQMFNCGYYTNTTKSRLNAILSAHGNGERVYQRAFEWFVSTSSGDMVFDEGMILN
jgi:hypothetical protein